MELNIEKVAQALNLSTLTIQRWIRQGRIPIRSQGQTCLFKKSELEEWAQRHDLPFELEKNYQKYSTQQAEIGLHSAVKRGGLLKGIKGKDVESVLWNAVYELIQFNETNREKIYNELLKREQLSSTSIGEGVALPHPRTPLAEIINEPAITTCFLENAIDYSALDGKPVSVLFILLCPSTKIHLSLLSRLSFCLRKETFIHFLHSHPEEKELCNKIVECESQLNSSQKPQSSGK